MRYIVYADRLFLLQAALDMTLLLLTEAFLNRRAPSGLLRLAACSAAEALFFCAVFLMPGIDGRIKNVLFAAAALAGLMIALRIRSPGLFLRAALFYHGGMIFLGGLWEVCGGLFLWANGAKAVKGYPLPSALCALALALAASLFWAWERRRRDRVIAEVELIGQGAPVSLRALIDSGNHLYDPISRKPVSVVERSVLEDGGTWNEEWDRPEKYRVVVYHTLSGSGTMRTVEVNQLKVKWEGQDLVIDKALLGLYDGEIAKGGYRMILHPALLKMGGKRHDIKSGDTGKDAV